MWCEIFADTSVVAYEEDGKKPVGFISGYIRPDAPDTLFIWQVAVHESQRGQGLATKMLFELLEREGCKSVEYLEATVSPSNKPSQNLFLGLAQKMHTNYQISDYFTVEDFPQDESEEEHEEEWLYKIGPFNK
jgi:L-2,4-diaminobutyric acid acetyltransferase